ncbi:alpha/beta fold hydrolase [Cyanothece sp. BG0011]|uniref:alpha/beta fold hydrolase n=1 Tax=Cyanothece sp. BG0011 TaxID=2082950 RepID=UPI000D1E72A4|nr:alpha/beta fold hydrolase [Cyanothece sp. BG0011]
MRLLSPFSSQPIAPLFIYFPGMDGTGQLFHRQGETLKDFFSIRCLSIPSNDQSDWQTLVKNTVTLIRKELESHPHASVYLCGESFGGCLAIQVALAAPELMEKVILVNPASSFNKRAFLRLGVELNQWIPNFVYKGSALVLLSFLGALNRITNRDSRALYNAMQSLPQEVVSWRLSLLRDFEINEKKVRRFEKPILVLASQEDKLLPSVDEGKELVNYFPNSRLAILPESGHACLLETDVNLLDILKQNNFIALPAREQPTSSRE